MINWTPTAVAMPEESTWCLCYCRVPKVVRNGVVTRYEQYRYLVLQFLEGEFWVNKGAPQGFVLFWAKVTPPHLTLNLPQGVKARSALR